MANTIVLKRSSVAAKVPLTTDLSLGELAINTYDGKVYIKKNNGADAIIEIGPVYSFNTRTGNITLTASDVTTALGSTFVTNATNVTNTGITNDVATAVAVYPTWVTANTGNLPQKTSSTKLSFVPSTGILTATGFVGSLTGNCSGSSGYTSIVTTNSDSTNTNRYIPFVGAFGGATYYANTNLSYNPSTSTLTTGTFVGALTGNASTASSATKSTNIVGGNNTTLLGSIPYQSNTDATTLLAPNTATTQKFLAMTGTGTNGAAPTWETISVSASPSGSSGQIQYNNAGAFGGVAGAKITANGDLELVQTSTPSVPSAVSNIVVYKSNSAYPSISVKHPDLGIGGAADDLLQPHFGSKDIGWWNPPGNATSVPGVLGLTAPTANGTATARTTASTTAVTRTRRLGYVTAATVNTQCGQSWTVRQWTLGNGSGLGGFYMVYRFAVSDVSLVSTGRWTFVGMTTQSGVLSALPTTACFGLIQGVGGTNYKIRFAGGSLGTDVDLGANFPIDLTSVYEVRLFSSPFDTTAVEYEVIRLNTGDTARGTFSTSGLSPNSGTLLAPQAVRSTGATQATVVGIDIMSLYIEKTF